jgi:glutathionyl-hydroquinone reductase
MPSWPAKELQHFRRQQERMAHKEIRIDMDEINNAQTITRVNQRKFAEAFGDPKSMHHQEVDELIDDFDKHQRILKVRGVKKYFLMGGK